MRSASGCTVCEPATERIDFTSHHCRGEYSLKYRNQPNLSPGLCPGVTIRGCGAAACEGYAPVGLAAAEPRHVTARPTRHAYAGHSPAPQGPAFLDRAPIFSQTWEGARFFEVATRTISPSSTGDRTSRRVDRSTQ